MLKYLCGLSNIMKKSKKMMSKGLRKDKLEFYKYHT